jgi:hypothetical protein
MYKYMHPFLATVNLVLHNDTLECKTISTDKVEEAVLVRVRSDLDSQSISDTI